MTSVRIEPLDLMPPEFSEGLEDWSLGDGSPDGITCDVATNTRLARGDADFGTCLELRKVVPLQRLRYMGEVPYRRDMTIVVSTRLKSVRGPIPGVRAAAGPGGAGGRLLPDLASTGPERTLVCHGRIVEARLVIGPELRPGVDFTWDDRALYTHVGLDLTGPAGGVVRIEAVRVEEVTDGFPVPAAHPGFGSIV